VKINLEPLGDAAYIVREPPIPAYLLARALNRLRLSGLMEVVPSYDTLGIFIEPETFSTQEFEGALEQITEEPTLEPRQLKIPVCFELGEDLAISARHLEMSAEALISTFCATQLTCYAVGFCPGFPYLGYLPEALSKLKRLESPRTRVPKGSVAITGDQAGIYTLERPGGWRILGRTPLELVNVEDEYFPIEASDQVQFYSIDSEEYSRLEGERL